MDREQQQVGFPWLLVIQIVLAIISYLIQKSDRSSDRAYLGSLHSKLKAGFQEAELGSGWGNGWDEDEEG
ncbi:MAG: hypothetical protein IKE69_11535 [Thermoguttaceae bacterium]|nr:hypothetical protein [Thermoguttaceae bacterium]